MNLLNEFDTMGGTEYRNDPAVLVTPEVVTQEVSAPMCSKSIPNSPTESIRWPSVPPHLSDRVTNDPPRSFTVLPPAPRRFNFDPWDYRYPMAPAVPSIRQCDRNKGYTVDWIVVRCPFCQQHHVHYDLMAVFPATPEEALQHSCTYLGGKRALCTAISPLTKAGPNGTIWSSADYFIVGIDRIPATAELNSYFPLASDFITVDTIKPQDGYVYLMEAGGHYKIGVATDVEKRLRGISTNSPYPVRLIHVEHVAIPYQAEKILHTEFAAFRAHREWFAFPDHLIPVVIAAMKGGAS